MAYAMAFCSKNSMYKLATVGDTGLPMAVPNFCLYMYMVHLNTKYVVVSTNSHSSMSSTSKFVLFFKVL